MRAKSHSQERGSALVMTMILIGVLLVIGVATVSLSSQERNNAGAKARLDFARACGNAAQGQIWSELAAAGLGYLGSNATISPLRLADGTQLAAGHYGADAGSVTVSNIVFSTQATGSNPLADRDYTSSIVARSIGGTVYAIQARCIDPSGNEVEVEFAVRFAL
jgi:hypothetical protein